MIIAPLCNETISPVDLLAWMGTVPQLTENDTIITSKFIGLLMTSSVHLMLLGTQGFAVLSI